MGVRCTPSARRRIRALTIIGKQLMERANRTLRESLDEHEVQDRYEAEAALTKIIDHYNHERLHSALGFKAPVVFYRGNPTQLYR